MQDGDLVADTSGTVGVASQQVAELAAVQEAPAAAAVEEAPAAAAAAARRREESEWAAAWAARLRPVPPRWAVLAVVEEVGDQVSDWVAGAAVLDPERLPAAAPWPPSGWRLAWCGQDEEEGHLGAGTAGGDQDTRRPVGTRWA